MYHLKLNAKRMENNLTINGIDFNARLEAFRKDFHSRVDRAITVYNVYWQYEGSNVPGINFRYLSMYEPEIPEWAEKTVVFDGKRFDTMANLMREQNGTA